MAQKLQTTLLIILTIAVGILFYLQLIPQNKLNVGFIRSQELVYQFQGMIDAMDKFEAERAEWSGNLDTLKNDYEKAFRQYETVKVSLSPEQLLQQEQLLQYQYNNWANYAQEMETNLIAREEEILEGVLNQVNAFSEEFAVENKLDLLVTTGSSGNILYGSPQLDYTEALLEYMNFKYEGK